MTRHLLLLLVLLSVPLTGQTWQPPRTPDGQPDMQGFWRTQAGRLEDGIRADTEINRVITGAAGPPAGAAIVDPPDGRIPYQPWAVEKRKAFIANLDAPTKLEHIDPHTRAWLDGVPRNNRSPGEIQFMQAPGYVLLLYSSNHAYRVIPLDGRSHVGEGIELFQGDSRGRWEGNTLVVDVTNQNDRTWLDGQSFHGKGLRVVERWTLVGPDRIDYRATLTDPTMFTQPWTIAYSFNRHNVPGYEIWEEARYEGERDVERILQGGGFAGRRKE